MNFLSEKAKELTPYIAGVQPQDKGWIKLNTNENPYPPSPKVIAALKNADFEKLRLYPDGDSGELRKAIADSLNREGTLSVSAEEIFCGNSSDEVLALAFQAFFSGKINVLTPDISYGFYPVWGKMYDVGLQIIPLREDFTLNPDDYINSNGVIIANPNAPTSLSLEFFGIEQILEQNPDGVFLVDEAYIDFADTESALSLMARYKNLLVVRTFSKFHALAGLRVGYATGDAGLIDGLRRVRDSFNSYPLDMLAQTGAAAAIQDWEYYSETISRVKKTRDKTSDRLEEMGYGVLKSSTNFLFMEAEDAPGLYKYLLENKILVRYWDKLRINNFLRVSVGTESDMEAFLTCVQKF